VRSAEVGVRGRARRLAAFLADRVAKWQVPERWSFIAEVPKTSVGKFDKKVLRARHENGELAIETL
jgi:fatty-acyl-CoA synthase